MVFHPTNGCLYLFTEMDTAIYVFGFDQQSGELSFKQKTCLLPKALLERAEIQGAEIQIPQMENIYLPVCVAITGTGKTRFSG